MPNSNKFTKIALLSASFILVAGFVVFGLEKANVINLYNKPVTVTADSAPKPVNTVDYSPATTTDQDEANNKLKQDLIDKSNKPQTSTTKIDVSLSAATQDVAGGPLVVRSMVSTSSGTCNLTLTMGTVNKSYSAEIINSGTYYSCKGFDIPVADLSTGKWQLKLGATNGQAYGEVSQEVDITK
jgi:hypothetical protein